jgi:RNA polymerase sigma-70 factor, ECF subfamily
MEINEQEIIARFKTGDSEAFGELYDAHVKKIYDFIFYKTLHKETAEDLTSIVFTKAFTKISTFSGGSFKAWLYQIARNSVIDYYRTKKQEKDIDDVWDLSGDEDIERDTQARISLDKVEDYLKILPSEQRDIIIMRVWQDLPHSEIAQALEKTESAVKVAYSRAIKSLRENMSHILSVFILVLEIFKAR